MRKPLLIAKAQEKAQEAREDAQVAGEKKLEEALSRQQKKLQKYEILQRKGRRDGKCNYIKSGIKILSEENRNKGVM